MRVRLLGTAAGGGFPQWNCGCRGCRAARERRAAARTQSSCAVSADGSRWFLLNASPDVRQQLHAWPGLTPADGRATPIEGVLLTNADLDHTLGLLVLREGPEMPVYASTGVRRALEEGLGLSRTLNAYCGIRWRPMQDRLSPLLHRDASGSGLLCAAISLAGHAPRYWSGKSLTDCSSALLLEDEATHGRLLYAPGVKEVDASLTAIADGCGAILLDGTFWSEDELQRENPAARSASQMGHLAVGGCGGSLEWLARRAAGRRMFVHMNNTNPMLLPYSLETMQVVEAGCEIAEDGMELTL